MKKKLGKRDKLMIKCHLIEQRREERRGEERRGEGGIGDKAEYHSCIKRVETEVKKRYRALGSFPLGPCAAAAGPRHFGCVVRYRCCAVLCCAVLCCSVM